MFKNTNPFIAKARRARNIALLKLGLFAGVIGFVACQKDEPIETEEAVTKPDSVKKAKIESLQKNSVVASNKARAEIFKIRDVINSIENGTATLRSGGEGSTGTFDKVFGKNVALAQGKRMYTEFADSVNSINPTVTEITQIDPVKFSPVVINEVAGENVIESVKAAVENVTEINNELFTESDGKNGEKDTAAVVVPPKDTVIVTPPKEEPTTCLAERAELAAAEAELKAKEDSLAYIKDFLLNGEYIKVFPHSDWDHKGEFNTLQAVSFCVAISQVPKYAVMYECVDYVATGEPAYISKWDNIDDRMKVVQQVIDEKKAALQVCEDAKLKRAAVLRSVRYRQPRGN